MPHRFKYFSATTRSSSRLLLRLLEFGKEMSNVNVWCRPLLVGANLKFNVAWVC